MIIKVLDFIAMLGTVVCLNMASRTYKAWGWYLVPTTAFIIVVASKGLTFSTILGVCLFFTGINNYVRGRTGKGCLFYLKNKKESKHA